VSLGYSGPLYLLAFDHRQSLQASFFGLTDRPTAAQTAMIADAKHVIFEGFLEAVASAGKKNHVGCGILVDAQFGATIADEASEKGIPFALPLERSGMDEFDFEHGDGFVAHLERFQPTFAKVLVRYNPEADAGMNQRQLARLARLSAHLHASGHTFMFELLVPAQPGQLQSVGGSQRQYDEILRPLLMVQAIEELHKAGVEPDIWKIEGLTSEEDCRAVAQAVRTNGRDAVGCVVLGRGADPLAVERWLEAARGVPGFIGFAIGRTLWWDPLRAYSDGRIRRAVAATQIAANYRRMIELYTATEQVVDLASTA
jgi:5-dehydro-2-deoxygluconokinase